MKTYYILYWFGFSCCLNLKKVQYNRFRESEYRLLAQITRRTISAKRPPPPPDRPITMRIKQSIAKIKRKVCFNNNKKRKSTRKIAKEEGCSTEIVIFFKKCQSMKTYIENVIPILNRDGNRWIGLNFTFQQDCAKPHTCKANIESIKSMGFSYYWAWYLTTLFNGLKSAWLFFLERG